MRRLAPVLAVLVVLTPSIAAAAAIDYAFSSVGADKTALKADGIDNALVQVTVKDVNLGPVVGAKVALTSSRGSQDEIRIENDVTDLLGRAKFRVFSLKDGSAIFTARAGGAGLGAGTLRAAAFGSAFTGSTRT